MNEWITLLINIVIGSVIGGVTNELAIRMLFRPYRPWMIGHFRVPFTPGLIPRRHKELGMQMGKVVENHLLTKDAVRLALGSERTERALQTWLTAFVEKWVSSPQSIRELLQVLAPALLAGDGGWNRNLRDAAKRRWDELASRWIGTLADKTLRELIGSGAEAKLRAAVLSSGPYILDKFRSYLHTPEGVQTVHAMLRNLLGGGMLGGLVGMFLSDEKLTAKVLPYLDELLQSGELSRKLSSFIERELEKLLDKPGRELLEWAGPDLVRDWSGRLFDMLEVGSLRFIDKPLAELAGPFRQTIIDELVPRAARWTVTVLEHNAEQLFQKLSVADIVARQVDEFPLERVEEMIIGISGKEFRMITVLGFLLGGMIGLMQGVLNLFVY
ncbi:DUF445 domain-containing protein [Brevibacillus sp. B_LB10_24]|uniref:DUF445 domain-containing protein n=1 Tax=Brevibacillus sp. B_LB10_24 TaxID=3380645 RepID=UPI0038B966E0